MNLTIFDSFEIYDVNILCCTSMWLANAISESNILKHIKIGHGLCGLSMSEGNLWGGPIPRGNPMPGSNPMPGGNPTPGGNPGYGQICYDFLTRGYKISRFYHQSE